MTEYEIAQVKALTDIADAISKLAHAIDGLEVGHSASMDRQSKAIGEAAGIVAQSIYAVAEQIT